MSVDRRHVVIAGGGAAGLETLLALRDLAGHRTRITLVSPEREYLYRPVTVAEAFDRAQARGYALNKLLNCAGAECEFVWDSLAGARPDEHVIVTGSGDRLHYDTLVVALGTKTRDPLPGAITFSGRGDVPALRGVLDELVSGIAESIAFTLPSQRMWTLPVYELALLTATYLQERSVEAGIWIVTPEEEPLELFGAAAAEAIEPMLKARQIRLRTSSRAAQIRGRALVLAGSGTLFVDRVVTLPQLEGPAVAGLPADRHGFIPVDSHGRVTGCRDVFAAGDATAFPLKQGGLATQQADAVAEMIAAELGVLPDPKPFSPVLRGLLMTGGAPLYLRSEPHRGPRQSTVAIDTTPLRRTIKHASAAAGQPLWWPPAKIAGRYLGPFLATARPRPLSTELLVDRIPVAGPPMPDDEYQDALELALLLADCDARWGDYDTALAALDAAQALQGSLPPEYETKRQHWRAAERV